MNTQQMQASCQAVIAVTQLREKANTMSCKVRPQEQLGKKRSVYFHNGKQRKRHHLAGAGSLENSTVTLPT